MANVSYSTRSCNASEPTIRALLDDQSIHLETLGSALRALEDTIDSYHPRADTPLMRVQSLVCLLQQQVDRIVTMQRQIYDEIITLVRPVSQPAQEERA